MLYPNPPDITLPAAAGAHAATHAPGGTDDIYGGFGHRLSTVLEPFPAWATSGNLALTSGTVIFDFGVADAAITLANFVYDNRGVATAGLTLLRMGLYTISGNTATLQLRSASSTTAGNSANTEAILASDTSSGLPATYTLARGTQYALAVIAVGTTPGNMPAGGTGMTGNMAARGPLCKSLAAQSDLPASTSVTGLANFGGWLYMAATT